jgi:ribosomal protein L21E
LPRRLNVGDRVKIQRDETRYPSKGTWPQFRGKTGTVVEINALASSTGLALPYVTVCIRATLVE